MKPWHGIMEGKEKTCEKHLNNVGTEDRSQIQFEYAGAPRLKRCVSLIDLAGQCLCGAVKQT